MFIINPSPAKEQKFKLEVFDGPWSEQLDSALMLPTSNEAGISSLTSLSGPAIYQALLTSTLASPFWSGLASKSLGILKSMRLHPVACSNALERARISENPSRVPSLDAFASSRKPWAWLTIDKPQSGPIQWKSKTSV
jgi:hypothetical protein